VTRVGAVVFDLDGVLIDSESVWDAVRRALTEEWGGQWHGNAHRDMMGMSAPEWSCYMHERLRVPRSPGEINVEVVRRMADAYATHLPLLPGAVDCVRRLALHWPLAVASSSNQELIDVVLREAGLQQCFRIVLSSEEVKSGKPAPDVYLEAANRLGVRPMACVAIEDSANGIRSAIAAGMRVVAVPNRQYPPGHEALDLAQAVVPSLREITPELVTRVGSAQ